MTSVKLDWMPSDSEENYKPLNQNGVPNYTKGEFFYELNSSGYRCDEFSEISELPVLFMGCSFTEGIGLPLNEVWSYNLHKKIVEVTGMKIPFWSVARGGTSIDYSSRAFYEYAPLLKPKYVFYFMSGISRREFKLGNENHINWFPNPNKSYNPDHKFKLASYLFSDPDFALYQTSRSLMILNSMAKMYGTKIYIVDIDNFDNVEYSCKIKLFNQFEQIDYIGGISPDKLNYDIPENLKLRPLLARDNLHPGAVWQYKLYSYVWDRIKINF